MVCPYSHTQLRWIHSLIKKHIASVETTLKVSTLPGPTRAIVQLDLENHQALLRQTEGLMEQAQRRRERRR